MLRMDPSLSRKGRGFRVQAPMKTSDFDFHLPEDRIALRPAEPRDSARLMVVRAGGAIEDARVSDLPGYLRPGDVMVFNDTRVIPARLFGLRERDGNRVAVQATLLKRLTPHRWTALAKPTKRLKVGETVRFGEDIDRACALTTLDARLEAKHEDGSITLAFDLAGPALDEAIREIGVMPLPPYIAAQRAEDERDRADYQTVYAREDGSVAAPTAGLHFTPDLLARLEAAGVGTAFVTLHVGAGTFLPVKVDDLSDHKMHAETGEVSPETAAKLNAARAAGGRIVCVGTTSLRLLESATSDDGVVQPFAGDTAIFITPGYRFRACDVLMTNFHLPKSTLLMLVSALAGIEATRAAYAHAVADGYRFYSYGDAGLWFRPAP
jgi:S-adenosylmethionine:tRNA ribosyltransferase-isomerase